jgi:hypothetical protein
MYDINFLHTQLGKRLQKGHEAIYKDLLRPELLPETLVYNLERPIQSRSYGFQQVVTKTA